MVSLNYPHLVLLDLVGNLPTEIDDGLTDQFLDPWLFLEGEPLFEIEPTRQNHPNFVLLFGASLFELVPDIEEDLVTCSN